MKALSFPPSPSLSPSFLLSLSLSLIPSISLSLSPFLVLFFKKRREAARFQVWFGKGQLGLLSCIDREWACDILGCDVAGRRAVLLAVMWKGGGVAWTDEGRRKWWYLMPSVWCSFFFVGIKRDKEIYCVRNALYFDDDTFFGTVWRRISFFYYVIVIFFFLRIFASSLKCNL